MSTTDTTTGSNTSSLTFNPIAQGIYNSLIQGGGNVLKGYMNDPFGNPAYTMGAAQSQRGAQQAGQNNMAALGQNMLTSGISGQAGAGFKQAQQAQTGRANQAMSSQANIQNVMQALQRQMAAAGTGLSFSPQLTGQTGNFNQSSTQSGLGTWLPQLAAALGGAAIKGATGGAAGMNQQGGGSTSSPSFGSGPNPNFMDSLQNPGFGMAGMPSGGLFGQLQSQSAFSGAPSPFMSMFNQQFN